MVWDQRQHPGRTADVGTCLPCCSCGLAVPDDGGGRCLRGSATLFSKCQQRKGKFLHNTHLFTVIIKLSNDSGRRFPTYHVIFNDLSHHVVLSHSCLAVFYWLIVAFSYISSSIDGTEIKIKGTLLGKENLCRDKNSL